MTILDFIYTTMGVEDHYPSVSSLTAKHFEKIKELRTRLAEDLETYPEYDTDFSMLRWLMGWDYDIETIVPKAKWAISVLRNLGMNGITYSTAEEVNAHIRGLNDCSEYFPGGVMCQDREGNVVYMQALAKTHPKTLVKADCVSELFKVQIIETELAFKLVRAAEKRTGGKLGVKIIMDLDGFSMDLLYTPTLKIYMNLLTTMQAVFPDFARKIYIINPPMMMTTVFAMVKPVLSKQTAEKVAILGNNWKEVLFQDIGVENVLPHWGGTKDAGCPTGGIRMGGKISEKYWYNASTNPHDTEKTFTKLNVPARGKMEVKVTANKGQTIRWLWRVSSGDIDFSVEKEGKEMWPKFRLYTDFVPEFHTYEVTESGEYVFIFDNSHGKVWSKDIKYKIMVDEN